MKIECNPEYKETERSVKMYLNDKQWDILRRSGYNGLWFFLRTTGLRIMYLEWT